MSSMQCSVCSEPVGGLGRLLPCLHVACAQCLQDMVSMAAAGGEEDGVVEATRPRCADCGEAFDVGAVTDVNNATGSGGGGIWRGCGDCDDAATHRCGTCEALLCVFHNEAHRRSRATATHATAALTDVDAQAVALVCATHAKELVVFCNACRELLCISCITNEHRGHPCLGLSDASAQFDAALTTQANVLTETLLPQLTRAQAEVDTMRTALQHRSKQLHQQIDAAFDPMMAELQERIRMLQLRALQLEERRNELKDTARGRIAADVKTLTAQRDSLDAAVERIEGAAKQAAALVGNTSVPINQRMRQHSAVLARIRSLQQAEQTTHVLIQDDVRFLFTRPGDLATIDAATLGSVDHERNYKLISMPSRVFGEMGSGFGQFNGPYGVAQLSSGLLAVGDYGNTRVQIFSLDGVFQRCVNVFNQVNHIAATLDGGFWVACCVANRLYRYNSEGVLVRQVVVMRPMGVAVAPPEHGSLVIVACHDRSCVQAFSEEGELRWTSTGNTFHNARGVAVAGGEVFVCDVNYMRIQVLALADGSFQRLLGNGMHRPCGVAVVPETDKIVVAEYDRMSIMTTRGEVVHRWGITGGLPGQFSNNWGDTTVLSDGRIAVADHGNNRVQLF